VGHFALLNPDPDPDSEYGSGSTDLIESGPNTDPDTKPWFEQSLKELTQVKRIFDLLVLNEYLS
jgi:hypothetical protein